MQPSKYDSFPRYLAAKKSVDDRALNPRVWQALLGHLSPATPGAPLQVFEIGAGIGTMLERLLAWDLLAALPGVPVHYTAIDMEPENVAEAHHQLPSWAEELGFEVEKIPPDSWLLCKNGREVKVRFHAAELFQFLADRQVHPPADLVIAHAFLDLVDIPAALPRILNAARPQALLYFTINFDGLTLLEPPIDPPLDDQIQGLYHKTMDDRDNRRSSGSLTGRRLFGHLRAAGIQVLEAGASDWVVFPGEHGYSDDEGYFLHFIIDLIYQALRDHPSLDPARFAAWIEIRHAQIERGELTYIAHQLDLLGRAPAI